MKLQKKTKEASWWLQTKFLKTYKKNCCYRLKYNSNEEQNNNLDNWLNTCRNSLILRNSLNKQRINMLRFFILEI